MRTGHSPRPRAASVLAALALACAGCATPASMRPVPSAEDRAAAAGWGSGTWRDQHEAILRIGRDGTSSPPDLIFLGDSITQSWGGPGRAVHAAAPAVWEQHYGARRAANFGISGDRTQHLLWRLRNGALDGLQPGAIVILIGTNNVGSDTPAAIARGIEAVYAETRRRAPDASILLIAPLPRGFSPADPDRRQVAAIRAELRASHLDLTACFTTPTGDLRPELFAGDGLHLSAAGYAAWAAAIEPWIARALGG